MLVKQAHPEFEYVHEEISFKQYKGLAHIYKWDLYEGLFCEE